MNEEPKSIWKKSWTGWAWLWAWLVLTAAIFIILFIIVQFIPGKPKEFLDMVPGVAIFSVVIASVAVAIFGFIRAFIYCCRHFKRFLFGLACLVTLIALLYAEEDWRGWHAWNQFKHQWEVKGEKFDFASIVPPPVPDDQNFAMAPIWAESIKATLGPERARRWKYSDNGRTNFTDRMPTLWRESNPSDLPTKGDWAKGTIADLKPWQVYYRTPTEVKLTSRKSITTNEFPIAPQPQTPAADVLLALSKFDPAIEELRQASRLPYSRFPLDYDAEDPGGILLPHLALLKRSAQVLQLRAFAELEGGQSEKALDDVKLLLRLTDAVRTEPFLISQLVRIAMLEECTLQPIYEGLAEHKWSDAQLIELDLELAKLDFLADCQNVQKSEIFFSAEEANYWRRHRDYAKQFAQWGFRYSDSFKFKFAICRYFPGGWFYQSALKNGRTLMEYLPAVNHDAKTISPALIRRADAAARSAVSFFDPLDNLKEMFGTDFQFVGNFLEKNAYGQSSVDMARVAIALERYRLAHGDYPESLDVLAPQFIEKVPHDVIGGQPLKYRCEAGGQFVLYSVGWNERDDGGVVVLEKGSTPAVNRDEGDWVWRYPAR